MVMVCDRLLLVDVDFWILLQYVSEKIGGAKGTELEDDIVDMEKVITLCTFNAGKALLAGIIPTHRPT